MGGQSFFWVCAVTSSVAMGCGGVPFLLPDARTPVDRAGEMEPKCRGLSETDVAPLLSTQAVEAVEPSIARVKSGPMDREARMRGALLHVRPLPGVSREGLTRGLECHQVRVVLGQVPPTTDDPYVLPGRWLDIDTDSVGDGFVVRVETDEPADAREVLARARRRFTAGAK